MRLHLEFAHLAPHQNHPVWIRLSAKPTGSSQHRAESLPGPKAVRSGMLQFAFESDHGSNVIPAGTLPDREDIAIVQRQICRAVALHGGGGLYVHVLGIGLWSVSFRITRKVGNLGVRAFLQPTRHANHVLDTHVGGKGIAAWFGNLAL